MEVTHCKVSRFKFIVKKNIHKLRHICTRCLRSNTLACSALCVSVPAVDGKLWMCWCSKLTFYLKQILVVIVHIWTPHNLFWNNNHVWHQFAASTLNSELIIERMLFCACCSTVLSDVLQRLTLGYRQSRQGQCFYCKTGQRSRSDSLNGTLPCTDWFHRSLKVEGKQSRSKYEKNRMTKVPKWC